MPLSCGKFLDRVGGGEALLGPAGAWQPMVCGTKVKGNSSLLACGSLSNITVLAGGSILQLPTWLRLALALGCLEQTSPCPTRGKSVLWSPKFPIYAPFLAYA